MFWVRFRSGIILVILMSFVMYTGGNILLAAIFFLSVVAYRELAGATGVRICEPPKGERRERHGTPGKEKPDVNAPEIIGYLGVVFYYALLAINAASGFLTMQTGILSAILFVFMGGMFVYVFGFPKFHAHQVTAAFFSFFYGPVCLSFIYLTRELGRNMTGSGKPAGFYIVWLIFLSSWGCDTCAYCVGMLLGKHKMSPVLSPKKSVEGAVGGVFGAAALGALYGYAVKDRLWGDGKLMAFFALICGVGALISMVGDLAASAVKRNADIKDYGRLIPGHGGVMDRFDSVIFTAPVIYFMSVLLLT